MCTTIPSLLLHLMLFPPLCRTFSLLPHCCGVHAFFFVRVCVCLFCIGCWRLFVRVCVSSVRECLFQTAALRCTVLMAVSFLLFECSSLMMMMCVADVVGRPLTTHALVSVCCTVIYLNLMLLQQWHSVPHNVAATASAAHPRAHSGRGHWPRSHAIVRVALFPPLQARHRLPIYAHVCKEIIICAFSTVHSV